jgi:hypothetical protein
MAAHFSIDALSREGPRDAAAFGVSALLPSCDFGDDLRAVWQTPVKALVLTTPGSAPASRAVGYRIATGRAG